MSLSRLRKQIQVIRQNQEWGSPVFMKWKEDIEACLTEEFGPNSRQLKQFNSLDYIGPIFFRDEDRNYFQEALASADLILQSFEDELSEGRAWTGFWSDIHPSITAVSKERYYQKSYADAVEAALKELNVRVKRIVFERTGKEYDGADLMNHAFSQANPIIKLEALQNESERNIQKGYQLILAGTMTGIRNPKAHANLVIPAQRARHFIYMISLLA